jgi:endonuclease I
MKMKYFLIWSFLLTYLSVFSQYYNSLDTTLRCGDFKTALHNHIKANTRVNSYDDLIGAHATYDIHKSDDGLRTIIWDMYSDNPMGAEPYEYLPISSDRCGTYNGEGDCYNREHSTPASWYNDATPMYTDFFNLVPTDGYVNGERSNWPMAKVGSASWISKNGSKLGSSATSGISGTVFEPRNEYKGDFARIFLYMSVRYQDVIGNLRNGNGSKIFANNIYPSFTTSAISLYIQWHNQDPPSAKEIARNNGGQTYQGNRNPFVDHPEWVYKIWGTSGSCPPDILPCTVPSVVSNLSLSNITSSSFDGSFSGSGATGYIVVLSQGNFIGSIINGTTYSVNQVIGNGTVIQIGASTTFNANSLNPGTSYTVNIFAYNNSACSGGPVYSTKVSSSITTNSDCVAPANNITNLVLTPSSTSVSVNFAPSPNADRYLIAYSRDPITFIPPNGTSFFTNEIIGNDTIAYAGTNTNVTINNLSPNTTYYIKVFAYRFCNGSPKYNSSGVELTSLTTSGCSAPPSFFTYFELTPSSTDILVKFNALQADRYMVIYSTDAITFVPTDNINYPSGTSIGNDIVYQNTTDTSIVITGLSPNTEYFVKVVAYNLCNGLPKYNPSSISGNTYTLDVTCIAPSTNPSGLSFNSVTATSISGIFFRSSLGADGYLILYNSTGYSDLPVPTDGISYNTFTDYGTYKVASVSNVDAFTLLGLNSNTRYYFKVFAYNNCSGNPAYNPNSANNDVLTLTATPMKVNANKNLEIYPNPLTGNELIVKNISPNTIESISCIDIQGKNIPYAYENCGNNTICIYFDNLAAGTYTLHLSSDSDMYSNKFIVIK